MRNQKAFTLIELLIVVAIIGILAAIAVPNFLNAQTRARVSRSMSEIRSLANTVQMYALDHNIPPFVPPGRGDGSAMFNMRPLTTPIAYMAEIPRDPFVVKETSGAARGWATLDLVSLRREEAGHSRSGTWHLEGLGVRPPSLPHPAL